MRFPKPPAFSLLLQFLLLFVISSAFPQAGFCQTTKDSGQSNESTTSVGSATSTQIGSTANGTANSSVSSTANSSVGSTATTSASSTTGTPDGSPSRELAKSTAGGRVVTRNMPDAGDKIHEEFVVGRVKAVTIPVLNQALKSGTGMETRTQTVDIEITEGAMKGSTVRVQNELTDNPALNISVQPGKEVILSVVSEAGKNTDINIADYNRAPVLITLGVVFLAAFLYFGGKGAIKSLVGLATAIGLIGFVLLPLSLSGFNPLLSSACICFVSACVTILCVGGWSRKSLAATIGTICGVIIAGIAAQLVIDQAPLTGLSSEESQILRASMMGQPVKFFSGLLAASMLIGALGVIMDVGISIASAIWELSQTDLTLSASELYKKGMNVGRDIMGSMTSTLVLAYSGSALPLLLLISTVHSTKVINLDLVASEIAAALTGSLGLVCTIPITALASARLMAGQNQNMQKPDKTKNPFESLDQAGKQANDAFNSGLSEMSSAATELESKTGNR